ncbi:MAG TPA: transporter substrate-binding domain-containing protein, partial [Bauldia sp.]|nr:transporter substrate-binding domain-containing protein [Bauldia sp.]
MSKILAAAALLAALALPASAAELPDLGGRTVRAVTENAYTPLNFADPKSGEGIGWEYDAFNEIAKRLNLKVEWNLSSWDTMIQAVREGQFDVGMDGITINDERKQQVDFSDPYLLSHPTATNRIAQLESLAQQSPYFNKKDPPELQHRHDMMRAKI